MTVICRELPRASSAHSSERCRLAYSFLQGERRQRPRTRLTLPYVRAVMRDVLTAHFFITQPRYLKWMLKLKDVNLRL
jgi:hypothetical protein